MGQPPNPKGSGASFIDSARIDALLTAIVPDAEDRAFVLRCILGEGPIHHRGANFALLALLGELVGELDDADVAAIRARGTTPVAMKVPPHLERPGSMMSYPLDLPIGVLDAIAPHGSPAQFAMVESLTDGPPQHALANAAMVWLIGAALERAKR